MTDAVAEFRHSPVLPAVALHGLGLAATASVLLLHRAEMARRLDLLGALDGELILLSLAHVIGAALLVPIRRHLSAGLTLLLAAALAGVGVALMAWTIELSLFMAGGLLFAVGAAPVVVVHRPLLSAVTEPGSLYRSMAWYWAAISGGLGLPLALRILGGISEATLLWICVGPIVVATAMLVPHRRVHDDDDGAESATQTFVGSWPRRSYIAAAGLGLVLVAGTEPALEVLVDTWQRSARQTAAVLGVGALAGLLAGVFGPWYHQLHRRQGSSRADAVGIQLLVAGTMVGLGALSFTYIGLIVCWAIAGAAIALAATGLDAAVFPSVQAGRRRPVAFCQLLSFFVGASIGLTLLTVLPEALNRQWRLALLAASLASAGAYVRRFVESPQAEDRPITSTLATTSTSNPATTAFMTIKAQKATVPRRVPRTNGERQPLLSVEKLNVGYGPVQVLFDVDLEVRAGQVIALLGTNGAGKTSLLRAISGLEPILGGRIVYAGLDITSTRPTWRVGMGLHQIVGGESVVGSLTVAENLRLFAYGIDGHGHDPAQDAYDTFPQLSDRRHQQAGTLSGGERQMLALSKALMVRPQLLLIDEFSLGLAPVVIAKLLPVVREIAARGAAILLVEQSANIALSVADYAYVIEKGQIGYHGETEALRARPDLLRSAYLEGLSVALGG